MDKRIYAFEYFECIESFRFSDELEKLVPTLPIF